VRREEAEERTTAITGVEMRLEMERGMGMEREVRMEMVLEMARAVEMGMEMEVMANTSTKSISTT
jgi:hypothetical protein